MRPRPRFFRLLLYALFMALVALSSTAITMHFAIHGAEVGIPDLLALTVADARQRAQANHLSIELDGRYYSADVPAGRVLTQRPTPGTVVRRGWRVRVSESLGPRKVAIPDVVGQPERISSIRIRRLGLELGSVAHLSFQSSDPDVVLAQSPPANTGDVSRPRVSILIADAPAAAEVSYAMPDFVGQLLGTAQAAAQRIGLHSSSQLLQPPAALTPAAPLASMTPAANATPNLPPAALTPTADSAQQHPVSTAIPGTITAQYPAPGSRVDAQTPIRFTVVQ